MVVSLQEYLDYAQEGFRFSVEAAWDQHRRYPEFSRGECLRNRSFLHSMLGGNTSQVFADACQLADQTDDQNSMENFLPAVYELMTERYAVLNAPDPDYEPGHSVRFATVSHLDRFPQAENWCYLHFYNAKRPHSFLEDPRYFADNLRHSITRATAEHSCEIVYTATWLNAHEAFLRFFPESWRNNMFISPDKEVGPTGGYQYQFLNRMGLLNRKTADYYLQTGVLKYKRNESFCPISELLAHLEHFS